MCTTCKKQLLKICVDIRIEIAVFQKETPIILSFKLGISTGFSDCGFLA